MSMNSETKVRDLGVQVPAWVDQDITLGTLTDIIEQGAAEGAYMPAASYDSADAVMALHGDEVMEYLEDTLGEPPAPAPANCGWSGLACYYLSAAVEIWAASTEAQLAQEAL